MPCWWSLCWCCWVCRWPPPSCSIKKWHTENARTLWRVCPGKHPSIFHRPRSSKKQIQMHLHEWPHEGTEACQPEAVWCWLAICQVCNSPWTPADSVARPSSLATLRMWGRCSPSLSQTRFSKLSKLTAAPCITVWLGTCTVSWPSSSTTAGPPASSWPGGWTERPRHTLWTVSSLLDYQAWDPVCWHAMEISSMEWEIVMLLRSEPSPVWQQMMLEAQLAATWKILPVKQVVILLIIDTNCVKQSLHPGVLYQPLIHGGFLVWRNSWKKDTEWRSMVMIQVRWRRSSSPWWLARSSPSSSEGSRPSPYSGAF